MARIDQFRLWAQAFLAHCRQCSEGCSPRAQRCKEGWQIATKCVSVGPVAEFKRHEEGCPECLANRYCGAGTTLIQNRDGFMKFLSGLGAKLLAFTI
jgi:hypothetical protein